MQVNSATNRFAVLCACILTAIPSTGFAHPEDLTNRPPPAIETPEIASLTLAKVIRIFDADTVLLQIGQAKHRYQLLGANAPEFQPKAKSPKPFSIESRRFIEQLLLGESVYIQLDPLADRDAINRRTAYIFRAPDMLFVNLELVRQGYAKHDPRGMSLYTDAFHYYESKAQTLTRGIWNPDANHHRPTPADEITEDQEPSLQEQPESKPQELPKEKTKPTDSKPITQSPSTTIYITKSGSKYHTKDCPHLSASNKSTTRDTIKDTHQPCKTCKPDDK